MLKKKLKAKIATDPALSDDPVEEWRGRWSRCEMVESGEAAGRLTSKSHLGLLTIYKMMSKLTLPGSPPKAAMFSCTHSNAALWLRVGDFFLFWGGGKFLLESNLIPESSVARSLLHA